MCASRGPAGAWVWRGRSEAKRGKAHSKKLLKLDVLMWCGSPARGCAQAVELQLQHQQHDGPRPAVVLQPPSPHRLQDWSRPEPHRVSMHCRLFAGVPFPLLLARFCPLASVVFYARWTWCKKTWCKSAKWRPPHAAATTTHRPRGRGRWQLKARGTDACDARLTRLHLLHTLLFFFAVPPSLHLSFLSILLARCVRVCP